MKNFMFLAQSTFVPPPSALKFQIFGAGLNNYGECALNGNGNQWQYGGDAYLPYLVPIRPGNGFVDPDEWKQFHMTYEHTLAIKQDGTLWVCGNNSNGQLGLGDNNARRTLTKVGTKNNWVKVQAATEFSAALDADGNIWTCGDNATAAQLNDGTTTGKRNVWYNTSTTPAEFHPPGVKFVDIAATHRFVMALDDAGNLWTWGNNGSRQLGRGSPGSAAGATADPTCAKVDVPGPFKKLLAGDYHAGGIHEDGKLWAWGLTSDGQRGQYFTSGNNINYPQEIPPNEPGTTWVDAYFGQYNTFLYRSDGKVYVTGRNNSGQLGLGTDTNVMAITLMAGAWKYIISGLSHTVAIDADGTLWACGNNNFKQLGSAEFPAAKYNVFKQISTETGWDSAYPGQYSTLFIKKV